MNYTKFLLSSNPENLRDALRPFISTATVEAEYGGQVVEGNVLTMAHHGSRAGQPAPCSYDNNCCKSGVVAVGLSHLDLDSLGGCAALVGRKPEATGFWKLAEFVDLNGLHKIGQSGASAEDIRRLYAFLAWNEANKNIAPKDGSVADVTLLVMDGISTITAIVNDNQILLQEGHRFKIGMNELNTATFVEIRDDVILRVGSGFVNHLYTTPSGKLAKAVVGFKTTTGDITVSFADKPTDTTAVDILQYVFGDKAGGHASIAGSPRDERCGIDKLKVVFDSTCAVVSGAMVLRRRNKF